MYGNLQCLGGSPLLWASLAYMVSLILPKLKVDVIIHILKTHNRRLSFLKGNGFYGM